MVCNSFPCMRLHTHYRDRPGPAPFLARTVLDLIHFDLYSWAPWPQSSCWPQCGVYTLACLTNKTGKPRNFLTYLGSSFWQTWPLSHCKETSSEDPSPCPSFLSRPSWWKIRWRRRLLDAPVAFRDFSPLPVGSVLHFLLLCLQKVFDSMICLLRWLLHFLHLL